ncbi:MAG: OpgC domain-containing protein [Acidiphilium sp.]
MKLVRGGRDLRVDFFRGIALFCIFLDHIPHDALARFTVRNLALNDATEIFILLAGYAAALVYGRKLDRAGPVSAGADMLRRAWVLYVAHLFLFVIFAAEVAVCAAWFAHPDYIARIGLDHLAKAPLAARRCRCCISRRSSMCCRFMWSSWRGWRRCCCCCAGRGCCWG